MSSGGDAGAGTADAERVFSPAGGVLGKNISSGGCYDRDNRLRSKTLSIVREVGSGLYLNKQNASDEVLSVLE